MHFYKIITEFLDLSSAATLRHEHSFDKMMLNPGLTAYAVRLEDRLWIKWNPLGISFSGRRSPKASSLAKVSPERYCDKTRLTSSLGT